jgi:hypothetical protein
MDGCMRGELLSETAAWQVLHPTLQPSFTPSDAVERGMIVCHTCMTVELLACMCACRGFEQGHTDRCYCKP